MIGWLTLLAAAVGCEEGPTPPDADVGRDGAVMAADAGPDAAALDGATIDAATIDAATIDDAGRPDASGLDAGGALRPEPSAGCGAGRVTYGIGTGPGSIPHGGATRAFRVRVPPGYDGAAALPLVLMFHGGGGSGRQLEEMSSRMNPVADREGFVAVYPDGTGALVRTWNAGGCCGAAMRDAVDDVGFVRDLIEHLGEELCLDQRRVYASGMSNGAMLSHRLACELSDRIAAVAPVAGLEMSPACTPPRPVPVMQIHGTADAHVPWEGGEGCGISGVAYPSVAATMEGWRGRNGCASATTRGREMGDGACGGYDACAAGGETIPGAIAGGGHSWPGGEPRAAVIDCPADGEQSTTFHASEQIWTFFARHARP